MSASSSSSPIYLSPASSVCAMSTSSHVSIYRRRSIASVGGWLAQEPGDAPAVWLRGLVEEVDDRQRLRRLSKPVQQLRDLIESSAELRMLASAMFDEVPKKKPYNEDPLGSKQVRSYEHMLALFDVVMTERAPAWTRLRYDSDLIGFPFNAILDWPMATASGYAFFLNPRVNFRMKVILDAWRDGFLNTRRSRHVLAGEDGWLNPESLAVIERDANGHHGDDSRARLSFQQLFECDPKGDPTYWGFASWDDFFVRRFRNIDRVRPVAHADRPEWVVSACEARPFALQTGVREFDAFWLKGQPYSVVEMLNHSPLAGSFIGGTVYQAFLSTTSYHRWAAPVQGRVVRTELVEGTMFSEPTSTGFGGLDGPDPAGPGRAQGYITHVATRAIFYIEAPPPIGLMAAMFVGMADVSTCEIASKFASDLPVAVSKGEELGMFHYGGSTHCLLFRKDVKLAWVTAASPKTSQQNIPVRSELALAY